MDRPKHHAKTSQHSRRTPALQHSLHKTGNKSMNLLVAAAMRRKSESSFDLQRQS
jgi:hypothetical protein